MDEPACHSLPYVFNTGHSGAVYPPSFLAASRLDGLSLRRSEDAHVDRLFAPVVRLGAPLLRANFPRAFLDVNREPYELDPRMFEGRLPPYADGQEIYPGRIAAAEAVAWIETLYKPYHRTLRSLIQRTAKAHGSCVLIDCHSMPSTSLGRDDVKADVILGDRYGTACAPMLIDAFEAQFQAHGFRVVRNKPYAGGFITEHYGEPSLGRHALQIEVNRALYMNESSLALTADFPRLMESLTAIVAAVANGPGEMPAPRMAAE